MVAIIENTTNWKWKYPVYALTPAPSDTP
jgi:hypothetical protein